MGFGEGRVVYGWCALSFPMGAELSTGQRRNDLPTAVILSFKVKSYKKMTGPLMHGGT